MPLKTEAEERQQHKLLKSEIGMDFNRPFSQKLKCSGLHDSNLRCFGPSIRLQNLSIA